MNYTPFKQRGLTGIALMALLAILAFFVWIAIVLFPIYMENFKVSSHLHKIADEGNAEFPDGEIIQSLMRRFSIDDVDHVEKDDITIERTQNTLEVSIAYEVRKNVFGNIDLVVSFNEKESVKF